MKNKNLSLIILAVIISQFSLMMFITADDDDTFQLNEDVTAARTGSEINEVDMNITVGMINDELFEDSNYSIALAAGNSTDDALENLEVEGEQAINDTNVVDDIRILGSYNGTYYSNETYLIYVRVIVYNYTISSLPVSSDSEDGGTNVTLILEQFFYYEPSNIIEITNSFFSGTVDDLTVVLTIMAVFMAIAILGAITSYPRK